MWPSSGAGILLLVVALLQHEAGFCEDVALPSCPQVPSECTCEVREGLVAVECKEVGLARLAQSIGTSNVDELRISGCNEPNISSLPFNGVRLLEINDCNVATISQGAWKRLESSLEKVSLAGNRLTEVPKFGNLSNLLALNLNNNQIARIDEKAFASMRSLIELRAEHNSICDVPPNALDVVKKTLLLLDLSDNCLSRIPAAILRNAGELMYLDLSSNKIDEVKEADLVGLEAMHELRLNNNRLRRVEATALGSLQQLRFLYLHNNVVGTLDGVRLPMQHLEILDLSNNSLLNLPVMEELKSMKQVRLDGNLISRIEAHSFAKNAQLQLITLQNNRIAQVAKDGFASLNNMVVLLLGNNSISKIEDGMLSGMPNVQQLSMRNNTLTSLEKSALASLPNLTTLDLAYNYISNIDEGAFDVQTKMFWLDLSSNRLAGFKKGVFTKKIANILLDGNALICDDNFDGFLTYLVTNHVRTFLPNQPEITCAGPSKYVGVRLVDLMMKKANETLTEGIRTIGLSNDNQQRSLFSSFMPSLGPLGTASQADGTIPILQTITGTIPALRNIPGLGVGTLNNYRGAMPVPNQNLNEAIEQFTAPLVRFATGGQPVPGDIEQLIQSIPNFIVNVPGFGDIDLSKMDPSMISYVLKGGQVPGIDKATMDSIVQQTMQRMHAAAEAALQGKHIPDQEKHLPPLSQLPSEMVTQVISGEPLPGLSAEQTKTVMDYYTQQLPTIGDEPLQVTNGTRPAGGFAFSPEMFDLLKVLPPGYNMSKIPMEVITAVTRGEVPDMRLLPADLLEHFKSNTNSLSSMLSRATSSNATIEEIIEKLPVFERPELSTFLPYDINQLTSDMKLQREVEARHKKLRIYTVIALGFIGAITLVVVIFFVNYVKKQRQARQNRVFGETPATSSGNPSGGSGSPILPSRAFVLHSSMLLNENSKLAKATGAPDDEEETFNRPYTSVQVNTPRRSTDDSDESDRA